MNNHIGIALTAALVAFATVSVAAASDEGSSGGTTTSPSSSRAGTLIQTDTFPSRQGIVLNRTDASKYKRSRLALRRAIARFNQLSRQAKRGLTPKLKASLKRSLKTIRSHAGVVRSLSRKAKNSKGMRLASQMIINDDITGRVPSIEAAARRLSGLESQLATISHEPVSYR